MSSTASLHSTCEVLTCQSPPYGLPSSSRPKKPKFIRCYHTNWEDKYCRLDFFYKSLMNQVSFLIGVVKQSESCNSCRVRIILIQCLCRCPMPGYEKCHFPTPNFSWCTGHNINISPMGVDGKPCACISHYSTMGRQSASASKRSAALNMPQQIFLRTASRSDLIVFPPCLLPSCGATMPSRVGFWASH